MKGKAGYKLKAIHIPVHVSHLIEYSHMATPTCKRGWELSPLFWVAMFPTKIV